MEQTFDNAQEAFRERPSNFTAAAYLRAALDYEADGMIGDDTFRNALAEIAVYLDPNLLVPVEART